MHAVTGTVNVDDDRMMDHAIHHGGRNHRIAQIYTHGRKVDVGSQDGGLLAVSALDDFKKKRSISTRFLFQPIKSDFIDLCCAQHKSINVDMSVMWSELYNQM